MRRIYFICAGFFSVLSLSAQIIVDPADIVSAGDTVPVAAMVIPDSIDIRATGPDYFWDYSWLEINSERKDVYLPLSATSFSYLSFLGANVAVAQQGGNVFSLLGGLLGGGGAGTSYDLFKKSSARYEQVCIGVSLAGAPVPILYSGYDVVYKFPVKYMNTDSSSSSYSLPIDSSLSGLPFNIYYKTNQKRINYTDGWGTLKTPYGTAEVLRVKSVFYAHDSLAIDSFGFGFDRPVTVQFKWLAKGMDIPLLEIDATVTGNDTVPDNILMKKLPYQPPVLMHSGLSLYPNPFATQTTIIYNVIKYDRVWLELFDASGKFIATLVENAQERGEYRYVLDPEKHHLAPGVYAIRFRTGDETYIARFVYRK